MIVTDAADVARCRGMRMGYAPLLALLGDELRGTPQWLRPLAGWLMPRIAPRGLECAPARVEMKAIETVLHLRRERPHRTRYMIPAPVWALVRPYGLL